MSAGSPGGEVAVFKAVSDPDATLLGNSLQAAADGSFRLRIACPTGETSCEGTVTVQTAGAVAASARSVLTLATGHFKVLGGTTVAVELRLGTKARRLLVQRRSLRVRVRIAAHDPLGASHTSTVTATLRAPKKTR